MATPNRNYTKLIRELKIVDREALEAVVVGLYYKIDAYNRVLNRRGLGHIAEQIEEGDYRNV